MNLTLTEKKPETDDIATFYFISEQPFTWRAGQYLHYVLSHQDADDRGTARWFTIASAPFEGRIQLTTRIFKENTSSFKRTLGALRVDDTVEVQGPIGDFIIDDPDKDYIFIAGGSGITPFRAILMDLRHRNAPINVILMYANRTHDFVFQNVLEGIARRNPTLRIHYFVEPNRIDETALRARVLNIQKPLYYISGPEPMVEHYKNLLLGMKIPDNHIKLDDFPGYTWP